MPLRAAELEVLFTANLDQVAKAEKQVKDTGKKIESNPIKVDADAKGALASMDRVQQASKQIVSQKTLATVDANIDRAEKAFMRVYERLDYLKSVRTELDVEADIARAEAQLQRVQRNLDGLRNARTTMELEADPEPAEKGFKRFFSRFRKQAEDAGGEGGRSLAGNLDKATRGAGEKVAKAVGDDIEDTLVSALTAIPIAGGVILAAVGIGKAITGAIRDGMQVEVGFDRLAALTGLSEADALRIGRAAGEAYANVFGESVEANMDAARLALQFDIIDENATTRDAQKVIQGLAGIADVLGEDVRPVATAVTTLLRTGLVKSADQAFDVIAAGAREGANRNEDLLDTLIEYPALFQRLGLNAEEALGLVVQGMRAGARNSDLAADALKEFQIRSTDASEASAEGYRKLGLDAEEMTAKIARGGKDARDGLDVVLDRLRQTEDPVLRNAAAVALFGTQAEDLGEALFAMDLSSAVAELDGVTGAAERMFDTLADNDATKIERAQRNIEVAVDGIKGALAGAFAEPLGDFADWVSENRGPLLQFFTDLVNGAIDFGIGASESVGGFVSGPLAEMVQGLAIALKWLTFGQADTSELDALAEGMRGFEEYTDQTVEKLEEMRGKFNGFAEGQVALGYVNDASLRLANAIDRVGSSTGTLEEQTQNAVSALWDELAAAQAAGESQENLRDRYDKARQALYDQMIQTGKSKEEAQRLINTYLGVPDKVSTKMIAETASARNAVDELIRTYNGREIRLRLTTNQVVVGNRVFGGLRDGSFRGNLFEGMEPQHFAAGGLRSGIYPGVPGGIFAEAERGVPWESFISGRLADRDRNIDIWWETGRRLGVDAAQGPGVLAAPGTPQQAPHIEVTFVNPVVRDPQQDAWEAAQLIGGVGE